MSSPGEFTPEQKQYLQGFVTGSDLARSLRGLPTLAGTLAAMPGATLSGPASQQAQTLGAEAIHRTAQDALLAAGKKLVPEEEAKRKKNPFEMWDELRDNAAAGRFPKGTDIFLYKYHGLFYVAPAQDSFMTRLRFPCGIITSAQCRAVADIADTWGAGHVDITTRANLQIRELGAASAVEVINALTEAGILNRGSGADNLRNITGSATAGIDSQELYDTRPLCREMHHYILQHREMYGLPRKFNIAFDGGGIISALADTNDIGFMAVRVPDGEAVPAGVYFRMELGGITGHLDFARDTGVLLRPEECVPVAAAVVRVFIGEGDRTDRKRARLKYVLDRLGHDVYLQKTEALLGRPLTRFPLERCQQRGAENRFAHVGVHAQVQPGLVYVGLVLPVGRLTTEQLRRLAKLADRYGSGTLRLTVWQNLLLPDIPRDDLPAVQREVEAMGLHWSATAVRAGLIACTGAAGCKFAAAHTKQHALEIAEHLEAHVTLDQPVNIHLTGCHHSCAQHYIGDLGLLGTKVPQGDEMVEGYHIYSGGGYGAEQGVGRELYRNVLASDAPNCVLRIVRAYLAQRLGPSESLRDYLRRFSVEELRQHAEQFEEQLT